MVHLFGVSFAIITILSVRVFKASVLFFCWIVFAFIQLSVDQREGREILELLVRGSTSLLTLVLFIFVDIFAT